MTFSVKNQLKRPFSLPFEKTAGEFPSVEFTASDLDLTLQHLDRYKSLNWDENIQIKYSLQTNSNFYSNSDLSAGTVPARPPIGFS